MNNQYREVIIVKKILEVIVHLWKKPIKVPLRRVFGRDYLDLTFNTNTCVSFWNFGRSCNNSV